VCSQYGQHAGVERQVKRWRRTRAIFTCHTHRHRSMPIKGSPPRAAPRQPRSWRQ
jgi:hypothetical protein